jgi:hypothetical protein
VKVEPAAKVLFDEMKKAGFEEIIHLIPGSDGFWSFLQSMAEQGVCTSCREGGGNPGCAVRICAKEKNVEMCALCENYPCELFARYFKGYPVLEHDNDLLRREGFDAWLKLQNERKAREFIYNNLK